MSKKNHVKTDHDYSREVFNLAHGHTQSVGKAPLDGFQVLVQKLFKL